VSVAYTIFSFLTLNTFSSPGAAYEIFVNFEEDRDQMLDDLMNLEVRTALGLPEKIVFGSQSSAVFRTLGIDFMKPVTNVVELLLNKTEIHVVVVTGVLDLIVATPGTLEWVDKLQWPNATPYHASEREGLGVNGVLEGYYKKYDKFSMYWALRSGHMVPADNPAAMSHILRTLTTFG
jgi:serine carboxypeptidase 1